MKKIAVLAAVFILLVCVGLVYAQSQGYIVFRQGAKELTVKSGGTIAVESGGIFDVESGGYLKIAGTAVTGSAAELNLLTAGKALDVEITSATDTLTAADSGKFIIGRPLGAKTNLQLPTASAGLVYHVYVADTDTLNIQTATGDSLIIAAGTAAKTSGTVAGSTTVVAADDTRWFMLNATGTWTSY